MFEVKYDTIKSLYGTNGFYMEDVIKQIVRKNRSLEKKIIKENSKGVILLSDITTSSGKITEGNFSWWIPTEDLRLPYSCVQDMMLPSSVKIEGEPDLKDLKLFYFSKSNSHVSDNSEVIHTDPFLAYLTLRKMIEINNCRLDKIIPLELGHINHHRQFYNKDYSF
jgi:hypothetical protein